MDSQAQVLPGLSLVYHFLFTIRYNKNTKMKNLPITAIIITHRAGQLFQQALRK